MKTRQFQKYIDKPLIGAALALGLLGSALSSHVAKAAEITVSLDEARLLPLDQPVAQIIIGNPTIAEVTVQSRDLLVLTGKTQGETNMILLDANNNPIMNERIKVNTNPQGGMVVLHRGAARSSYHCGDKICSARVTLGDDQKYMESAIKASQSKNDMAVNAAK